MKKTSANANKIDCLCVDYGGSWLRGRALNSAGKTVFSFKKDMLTQTAINAQEKTIIKIVLVLWSKYK